MKQASIEQFETLVRRYPGLACVRPELEKAMHLVCKCHEMRGKVLLCGNGGSAADADHIAGELAKSFVLPCHISDADRQKLIAACPDGAEIASQLQRGVAAISLANSTALATAIGNDTNAEMIFAQQVYALGCPGDVVIGLSTSGNSRNVVQALKVARVFGMKTIGFTGGRPAAMDQWCDALIKVPSSETYQIQELHLPAYHALCLAIETELFDCD
jgi:D-sedoheptulose 7-phosphate isomerase